MRSPGRSPSRSATARRVNLYRPAWDDFHVTTVHGNEEAARSSCSARRAASTSGSALLDERFAPPRRLRGPGRRVRLARAPRAELRPACEAGGGADAWHPEDALFLPMRHTDGHLLGILSVDEPLNGHRPTDDELDVLVALAEHAALVVQSAQEAARAARHRLALEHLLDVSSRLTAEPLDGRDPPRRLHGRARRARLPERARGAARPRDRAARAARGRRLGHRRRRAAATGAPRATSQPLLDPAVRDRGLLPAAERGGAAALRARPRAVLSEQNGRGPYAWHHHWLLVPLHDSARRRDRRALGRRAGGPAAARRATRCRRCASSRTRRRRRDRVGARCDEVRFLADHDPLTRLSNRRAFVERLDGEVARATRYGRTFALVALRPRRLQGAERPLRPPGRATRRCSASRGRCSRRCARATRRSASAATSSRSLLAEARRRTRARSCGAIDRARVDGIRASFGVASCPEHARDSQTLFRLADAALYEAKRNGSGLQFVA